MKGLPLGGEVGVCAGDSSAAVLPLVFQKKGAAVASTAASEVSRQSEGKNHKLEASLGY